VTASAVLTVSRFEAVLLRMLRGFLKPAFSEGAGLEKSAAAGKLAMPKCLSAACLHLVRDTLGKGCVLYLAKAGGWRREKHLRHGRAATGRLWERTPVPELGLSFSKHSIELLMWLAAGRPDKNQGWEPPEAELTIADRFLMFLAYEGLRETEARQAFLSRTLFAQHGLIRLFFPEDFAAVTANPALDMAAWTRDLGASILEAMQPRLHRRWLEIERGKNQIGDWNRMRGIGVSQERALESFFAVCDAARRPDLARFLLKAMSELLSPDQTPAFWIGGLQPASAPARLADRLDAQRYGLAAVRQLECLAAWTRRGRSTGYLDEDYAIAQLWLADWEHCRGDEIATIAQQLLRQLEPLRMQSPNVSRPDANPPEAGTAAN
jgi:hypothetical protein